MVEFTLVLTRPQLEAARTEAAAEGIKISGDAGEIDVKGAKIAYAYFPDDSILHVTVEHVSFADKIAGWGEQKVADYLKNLLTPNLPPSTQV